MPTHRTTTYHRLTKLPKQDHLTQTNIQTRAYPTKPIIPSAKKDLPNKPPPCLLHHQNTIYAPPNPRNSTTPLPTNPPLRRPRRPNPISEGKKLPPLTNPPCTPISPHRHLTQLLQPAQIHSYAPTSFSLLPTTHTETPMTPPTKILTKVTLKMTTTQCPKTTTNPQPPSTLTPQNTATTTTHLPKYTPSDPHRASTP